MEGSKIRRRWPNNNGQNSSYKGMLLTLVNKLYSFCLYSQNGYSSVLPRSQSLPVMKWYFTPSKSHFTRSKGTVRNYKNTKKTRYFWLFQNVFVSLQMHSGLTAL